MGEKRTHSKAFQVGPANLPDGQRKRKAQRIKQALIDRAKIKKDYSKVQSRAAIENRSKEDVERAYDPYEAVENDESADKELGQTTQDDALAPASLHPDRRALIDSEDVPDDGNADDGRDHKKRRDRKDPYAREIETARRQRDEAERRRKHREEANRQREQAMRERANMQRLYKKANTLDQRGNKRLGRESELLLAKVKRMVATGR